MAADIGRRILITGVSRFLGLRLAKRLEDAPGVDAVFGVDLEEPPVSVRGMEFIRADIRNPMIARVLESTEADTIVHTNIASSPARAGGRSQMKEINVIGTMQLLAAAQRASHVKRVVVRSSAAVYGSRPGEPSIIPEEYGSREVFLSGYGKDCSEAEEYVRNFGRRRPDVGLVILRTQNVIGPTVQTNITRYLSLPAIPTAFAYDPRLQLLHEEDATEALYLALHADGSGIFNVAGDGAVYLSQAIRLLGKPPVPLVLPAAQFAAGILRRAGVLDFPRDQLALLLFGRVLDTARARAALGFEPRYDTKSCIEQFARHRSGDVPPEPAMHPTWERELGEYLRRKAHKEQVDG